MLHFEHIFLERPGCEGRRVYRDQGFGEASLVLYFDREQQLTGNTSNVMCLSERGHSYGTRCLSSGEKRGRNVELGRLRSMAGSVRFGFCFCGNRDW